MAIVIETLSWQCSRIHNSVSCSFHYPCSQFAFYCPWLGHRLLPGYVRTGSRVLQMPWQQPSLQERLYYPFLLETEWTQDHSAVWRIIPIEKFCLYHRESNLQTSSLQSSAVTTIVKVFSLSWQDQCILANFIHSHAGNETYCLNISS